MFADWLEANPIAIMLEGDDRNDAIESLDSLLT